MDKQFTESKKMLAFVIAIAVITLVTFIGHWLGLPAESIDKLSMEVLGLAGMAIGGQAMVDFMTKIANIFTKKNESKPKEIN